MGKRTRGSYFNVEIPSEEAAEEVEKDDRRDDADEERDPLVSAHNGSAFEL
jgi:hypothetical protein